MGTAREPGQAGAARSPRARGSLWLVRGRDGRGVLAWPSPFGQLRVLPVLCFLPFKGARQAPAPRESGSILATWLGQRKAEEARLRDIGGEVLNLLCLGLGLE